MFGTSRVSINIVIKINKYYNIHYFISYFRGEYDEYSEVTRTEIDDQDLMIEKKNQEDINNEVKEISLDEQNVEQNDEQNVENEEDKTEQSEEMKNVEETESDL